MRKRTAAITAGVVVAATLVGGGAAVASSRVRQDSDAERRSEAQYTDAHRADAAVSQAEAERAATALHPGTIVETHLENEGNGLRWEVKPDDGSTVWEVQVDAQTGKVVSDQHDDD